MLFTLCCCCAFVNICRAKGEGDEGLYEPVRRDVFALMLALAKAGRFSGEPCPCCCDGEPELPLLEAAEGLSLSALPLNVLNERNLLSPVLVRLEVERKAASFVMAEGGMGLLEEVLAAPLIAVIVVPGLDPWAVIEGLRRRLARPATGLPELALVLKTLVELVEGREGPLKPSLGGVAVDAVGILCADVTTLCFDVVLNSDLLAPEGGEVGLLCVPLLTFVLILVG